MTRRKHRLIGTRRTSPARILFVPSPRLLAVTALVALGGLAGVISAGGDGSDSSADAGRPTSNVRGGLVSNPAEAPPVDIAAENERTGDQGWRIAPARGTAKGLAAYAGAVSVTPGSKVPLYLKGKGTVDARAFRLGWYGGTGARQVWDGTLQAQPQAGRPSGWQSTAELNTSGWPEGTYLVRLDLGKASRYVPLTVTSKSSSGRVVVLTSPMTWAATTRTGSVADGKEVTLNRPLPTGSGAGALPAEAGVIAQIERTGTPVVYLTDADLAASPELVNGATAVLVAGESRYWTPKMRASVREAVAAGTNLALFGAGTAGATAVVEPDAFTTAKAGNPASSRLSGSVAACTTEDTTGLTVQDPTWWGFEGGVLDQGEVLKGLVSGRADKVNASSGAELIGSAELDCGDTQATSYLRRPSGAEVFNVGTGAWACTVSGHCTDSEGRRVKADARAQDIAALVTRNVVTRFATPKEAS